MHTGRESKSETHSDAKYMCIYIRVNPQSKVSSTEERTNQSYSSSVGPVNPPSAFLLALKNNWPLFFFQLLLLFRKKGATGGEKNLSLFCSLLFLRSFLLLLLLLHPRSELV